MSPDGNGSPGHRPPRNMDPAWQMAEHLDSRLRLQDCDEASIARALLLMSELHGMSRVARACGMRPAGCAATPCAGNWMARDRCISRRYLG